MELRGHALGGSKLWGTTLQGTAAHILFTRSASACRVCLSIIGTHLGFTYTTCLTQTYNMLNLSSICLHYYVPIIRHEVQEKQKVLLNKKKALSDLMQALVL